MSQTVEDLARRLTEQIDGISQHDALRAAELASSFFEADTELAADYEYLRDAIMQTMPDPDAWDGDGAEAVQLAQYVTHLSTAQHGTCVYCGQPIKAGCHYEMVLIDRRPTNLRACSTCIP